MKNLMLFVLMFTTSFVFGSTLPEYDVGIEKACDMNIEQPSADVDFLIIKSIDVVTNGVVMDNDNSMTIERVIYFDAITSKPDPAPDLIVWNHNVVNIETNVIKPRKAITNKIDRLLFSSGGVGYNCKM